MYTHRFCGLGLIAPTRGLLPLKIQLFCCYSKLFPTPPAARKLTIELSYQYYIQKCGSKQCTRLAKCCFASLYATRKSIAHFVDLICRVCAISSVASPRITYFI